MSDQVEQSNPVQAQTQQPTNMELNFRKQEAHFKNLLAQKEAQLAELNEAKKKLESLQSSDDDDHDDEPYVDKKKLDKKLAKFGQQTMQQTQSEIQKAVQTALAQERRDTWMKNNADFHEVLSHAEKLAQKNPQLAETILEMPDTFERQKLVYNQIKAMGLHQPEQPKSSIQETIDKNKRSPYYQPSGISNAPYAAVGDFSSAGQKQAFEKMQELKARLRM